MQPPTTPTPPRGDEDQLFRRHHHDLQRTVARAVTAPPELIEDACQMAWATLLRHQPERYAIFGWLRAVAIREAWRLSKLEHREVNLEGITTTESTWHEITADPRDIDDTLEAREALRIVATLPDRQRIDLALVVAGFSYLEIAELTGGRTFTNVNKHLVKARARLRLARVHGIAAAPRCRR